MRYTFGDDESAVRRLELVADAYEPTSRAFLARHAAQGAPVAVDLGCGPGYSTGLLGDVCRPGRLIGVDSSAEFLDVARCVAPQADFEVLDLSSRSVTIPVSDVIYARLLLAHLPDPMAAVETWRNALTAKGVLLVEDLDHVEAPPGALSDYEELSARVVQSAGGVMYGGKALAAMGGSLVPVTVPAPYAAEVYMFNVQRWLARPDITVPRHELARLASELDGVRARNTEDRVSWVVRQVVVGRSEARTSSAGR